MLTRELLSSGNYIQTYSDMRGDIAWTEEDIQASLHETLRARPGSNGVWLFAYGSLIWNPLVHFDSMQVATAEGWHRSFCLRMTHGRAQPDCIGRMLAVEPGGTTRGIALHIEEDKILEELAIIWTREMVVGAYVPTWARVDFVNGTTEDAIVFVANSAHPVYEKDSTVATIGPAIAKATGPFGTNAEYVTTLADALRGHSLVDEYIEELVRYLDS